MCQAAVRIECPTAVIALWRGRGVRAAAGIGRRGTSPWSGSAPIRGLGRASHRSHLEPLRVLPERRLPPDSFVAGAHAGPGGEVLGGRERVHVDADLGDQHLGGALLDAGDRHQQLTLPGERGDPLLDLARQPVDRLVEEVDVREDLRDDQRVLGVKAAHERLPERGDLLAQLALWPARRARSGSVVPVKRARRASPRPDLPRMSVATQSSLMPGVLEDLVQPRGLALALLDLRLAIPGQVPQGADRLGRHETRASAARPPATDRATGRP